MNFLLCIDKNAWAFDRSNPQGTTETAAKDPNCSEDLRKNVTIPELKLIAGLWDKNKGKKGKRNFHSDNFHSPCETEPSGNWRNFGSPDKASVQKNRSNQEKDRAR